MLQHGAVTVDFQAGWVYGDIDHCSLDQLLESARTLINVAPQKAKAIGKAYDNDCYLYGSNGVDTIPTPSTAIPIRIERDKVTFIKIKEEFTPQSYDKRIAMLDGTMPVLQRTN